MLLARKKNKEAKTFVRVGKGRKKRHHCIHMKTWLQIRKEREREKNNPIDCDTRNVDGFAPPH